MFKNLLDYSYFYLAAEYPRPAEGTLGRIDGDNCGARVGNAIPLSASSSYPARGSDNSSLVLES